mgnify:CR=1 FL=1
MKKRLTRMMAGILFVCMVLGYMPAVYGAETGVEDGYDEVIEEQSDKTDVTESASFTEENSGMDSAGEDNVAGDATVIDGNDNAGEDVDTIGSENEEVVSDNAGEETEAPQSDELSNVLINFVYIESPYLETPGTQRIVFFFDNELCADTLTLTVADNAGNQEEWGLTRQEDALYLFEKEYSDESYTGTYQAIRLNIYKGDAAETILLEDQGVTAEFGINQEYAGIEELQAIDEESEDASLVGTSVVTIDESGVAEAQDSIADALNAVSADVGTDGISTYSLNGASRSARSGDIVVALDPGHDSSHAGASGNGLREEELTLKIANYCKEELEQYAGVSVYMTRTNAACPYPGSTSSGDDIGKRVNAAADAGAQIFVSFHLNSSNSSVANGAEIIIPNSNWKPDVAAKGEALAREILDELVALGLHERSIYSKDTTLSYEKYPDGSKSDYFSVQIYSKERGIPGIIIEHAFISNSSDANNFLKTEEGLKKLGVADATGIAQYLGLSKAGQKVSVEEGTYNLESVLAPGKNIEVSGNNFDSGAGTILYTADEEKSNQRFEIVSTGDGYYNIIAEHSGKALEAVGDVSAGYTYIQQKDRDSSSQAQKWEFYYAGDGSYYIRSALGTNMDVYSGAATNGNMIWTYTGNQTVSQRWKLEWSEHQPLDDGTYTISNSNNLIVNVASASIDNYANVQLNTANGNSAQRFEISYVGNGYYKIIAEHSNKSIDISNGSSSEGANIQQYEWNGSDAQLWKFVDAGSGNYFIRSKRGTVMSLASSVATDGTNVCTAGMSDVLEQKWSIDKSDYRPIDDGRYVIYNAQSLYNVLSISNSNAQVGIYAALESQMFDISYVGEGYYKILCADTKKSLDIQNGSNAAGANLQEYTWNGSDAQLWKFIANEDGSYTIKSKLGTAVDISGGVITPGRNILMYTINGTAAQKWRLESEIKEVDDRPISNGTYTISNYSNVNQVLDVSSASENDGGNIQIYASNDSSAQRFELYYVGEGYYQIVAEHSGKALDISNGSAASGANVWQYTWNGSDAQLWRILDAGDGAYYLVSKLGTVLDVSGSTAHSGANVQTSYMGTSYTQKWKFTKSSYKPVSEGLYSLKSSANSTYAVDIANGSKADKANAWLYSYNGSQAQQFRIQYVEDGYYKISANHSGKVLEVAESSRNAGANVQQNSWDGSDGQLWKFVKDSKGTYYIRSKTGNVLDIYCGILAPGTNIRVYGANGTVAQKWVLEEEYESQDLEDGVYTIQSSLNTSRVLDIANGSTANGANVWIYTANSTNAQKFSITAVSDGYYKIQSVNSGKVLDVANGSSLAGANVQQYTWNGSDAQLWRFIDAGNGEYYIQSKLGTALDVSGGVSAAGTNVQVYTLNNTTSQKWKLNTNTQELYSIEGRTSVTVKQMVDFYNKKSPISYPETKLAAGGAATIEEFAEIFYEEAAKEGIKAEVAWAQSMLETGWLKFGGQVKIEQFNFAGLGATDGGASGADFSSYKSEGVRMGVRAQIQHLKAYASPTITKQTLAEQCVDPRFDYVSPKGCASYVQYLGQKENPDGKGWATSVGYGYNILNLIQELKEM